MDKKQLKKLQYEQECSFRRKFPPVLFCKHENPSLKILTTIKKNERNINWKKYPQCEIKHTTDLKLNIQILYGIGDDIIKDLYDTDFLIDIIASNLMINLSVKRINVIKTEYGTGYEVNSNKIELNGKKIVLSKHAIDRISERALSYSCENAVDRRSKYANFGIKSRVLSTMRVKDCFDNKIGVFCPSQKDTDTKERMTFRKIGYLVLSEERNGMYYAKSFILPGYIGTPEEFSMSKQWEEINLEEQDAIGKKFNHFIDIHPNDYFIGSGSWSEFECLTPAWKKRCPIR